MPNEYSKDDLVARLRATTPKDSGYAEEANEAANRIEELEAECFKLAAGVCEHRSGNDHGNPLCLKTNQLI